jgi:hypothetical protein
LRWIPFIVCFSLILTTSTGCAVERSEQSKQKAQQQGTQSTTKDPQCTPIPTRHFEYEDRAEIIANQVDGVDQVVAVFIDNEMNVALQVTNFNRLKLKAIRKKAAQNLKGAFPKANIHVTTDSKLFNELEKLNSQEWTKNKACEHKKKLKQIEKDMRG